ncbi:hypothetical protein Hanom_Chr06g00565311 [Helianthus anomalus]
MVIKMYFCLFINVNELFFFSLYLFFFLQLCLFLDIINYIKNKLRPSWPTSGL